MNKYVRITGIVIMVSVFLAIAYDIWVIGAGGKDASISQVLIDYFYAYPIGSFAFGVVTGHLVWRMPDRYKITEEEYKVVLSRRK